MKKLLGKVLTAALPLALAACAANKSGNGLMGGVKYDKDGNQINQKVVVKKLNSVHDYLQYVDLERVYMGTEEEGSPAMFLGVPSVETSFSGGKKEAGVGYYFKGSSGMGMTYSNYTGNDEDDQSEYKLFKPWNDANVAKTGTTGYFGFPCLSDDNGELLHPVTRELLRPGTIKMDIAAINAKAMAAIDAIAAIPEAQRTEEQREKILELTDTDMIVLFGSVKKNLTADEQAKVDKARIAISKLHVMMNGFRMTAIPRGGIQSNCQSVTNDDGVAIGLMALDYLLPASGYESIDREFYVSFYNAVEKEVEINGVKRKIIVNADNQDIEVKADEVNLMTDAGSDEDVLAMPSISEQSYAWIKRSDSTFHNADILINLYKDAGYEYRKATTAELTTAEPFPRSVEICGLIKKMPEGHLRMVHQDDDYYKTVDVNFMPNDGKYNLYFANEPSKDTLAAAAKAKCGCIKGLKGNYAQYNVEPYINFSYIMHVDKDGFKALDDKDCSKFKDIP